jgi:hypothetical protein
LTVGTLPPDEPISWFWSFDDETGNGSFSFAQSSFYIPVYRQYLVAPTMTIDFHMAGTELECALLGSTGRAG